ncbi:MAG: FecR domain-containing protein [Burkholderiales bacterium]
MRRFAALLIACLTTETIHAAEPTVDFVVIRSDTLIGLSNNVLVSPKAWREVARLNRLPDPNRIVPGQVLKIPTRLMREKLVDARLVSAVDDVRVNDATAADGAPVAEGQSVQTGPGGSAVIALADGSRVRLPPSSLAQVVASRQYGDRGNAPVDAAGGWFAGTMRVLRGSVEVIATKVLRAKPLEVVTPTAVVGVRGTNYRVSLDDGADSRTRGEVTEGSVRFDSARAGLGADVPAGYGALADATGAAPAPVKLLAAPDLTPVPARFERPLVHFTLPAETTPLHVQVASDAAFDKIVSDEHVPPGTDVRIAGLDDAQWYLRARRVDTQGLEGFDATRPFVLKARPEPPVYRAPRSNAKQPVGTVEFAWAPNAQAQQVRLQIAEDEAFGKLVEQRDAVTTATLKAELKQPGVYYWRVASVRASGDQGPFGDPQRFELRPFPEPPTVGPAEGGVGYRFAWSGRPQDRQQVELASDTEFTQIVAKAELAAPEWLLTAPPRGGRYYFRYRSVEPDGYISPYSATLIVDVPRDWSILLLLLPALLLF